MTMARKRLVICFLVVLVVFGVVFSAAPNTALAAESSLNFDKTSVSCLGERVLRF